MPYLFNAINSIKVENIATTAVTIATNAPDQFAFVRDMFPSVTLKQQDEPDSQTLFFGVCKVEKEKEKEKTGPFVDPLQYTFSFFPKKASTCPVETHISIGLGERQHGVHITQIDKSAIAINPLQIYPYFLCITDRLESIQSFIEIIAGHFMGKKGKKQQDDTLEIFLPISSYPLLSHLKYTKLILSVFGTIELYDDEKNITAITSSDRGRILRVKPITDGIVCPSLI